MPAQYHLSQPFYEDQLFYGTAAQVVARDGACSVFKMKNETGEGIMTRYPVLRGIELIYNDMHIANVRKEENKAPCPDVMEINHCREGRFECEFPDGRTAYLGAGDLAVNMLTHPSSNSWFPLSHYHGISVMVDLPAAQETLRQISFTMGETAVDLYALRDRLCGGDSCFIMRATESIQHIFSELYAVPPAVRSGYCTEGAGAAAVPGFRRLAGASRKTGLYYPHASGYDPGNPHLSGGAFRPAYHLAGIVPTVWHSADCDEAKLQNRLWRVHRHIYAVLPDAKGYVASLGNRPKYCRNSRAGGLSECQQILRGVPAVYREHPHRVQKNSPSDRSRIRPFGVAKNLILRYHSLVEK